MSVSAKNKLSRRAARPIVECNRFSLYLFLGFTNFVHKGSNKIVNSSSLPVKNRKSTIRLRVVLGVLYVKRAAIDQMNTNYWLGYFSCKYLITTSALLVFNIFNMSIANKLSRLTKSRFAKLIFSSNCCSII